MRKIKVVLACVAVAGLTVLNFTQSRASFMRNTIASSSSESSETDTSTDASTASTTGEGAVYLSWSHAIECPAKAKSKTYYHVCQQNGYESSCQVGGSLTCECGRNCGGV